MGAFFLLSQQVREGAAGGLLADDMGLGKTLEMLVVVAVRGYLVTMSDHVRRNRKDHLPKDQKLGGKCLQGHYGGLQCPCEKGG